MTTSDPHLRSDVLRFLITECHALSPLRVVPPNTRSDGMEQTVEEESLVIRTRDDFDQFMRRCEYAKKTFHRGAVHHDDGSIHITVAYHQPDSHTS
jgi:hypothetical protein